MRQHPIPQNILDVEFKLFTKFTLKEFAYLAIGIGFAGIMVYLVVGKIIPGILGIPIAIITAGAGIFLGLVPINDQDADIFIKNYIFAITNPTQRVWLNKEMKSERIKPIVKESQGGDMIVQEKKKNVIGATTIEAEKEETPSTYEEEVQIKPMNPNKIVITDENKSNYEFQIQSLDKLPGNINAWLHTKDMQSVPNVIAYIKDQTGKIVYANKTGASGYFLTNKIWPSGTYDVEFSHPQYKFPILQLILSDKSNKLPIKISAL